MSNIIIQNKKYKNYKGCKNCAHRTKEVCGQCEWGRNDGDHDLHLFCPRWEESHEKSGIR